MSSLPRFCFLPPEVGPPLDLVDTIEPHTIVPQLLTDLFDCHPTGLRGWICAIHGALTDFLATFCMARVGMEDCMRIYWTEAQKLPQLDRLMSGDSGH